MNEWMNEYFAQRYTFHDVVYGYGVLTATSTSTVLPTTPRTSTPTPESTATTSAKTSGMAVEGVVFIALYKRSMQQTNRIRRLLFLFEL